MAKDYKGLSKVITKRRIMDFDAFKKNKVVVEKGEGDLQKASMAGDKEGKKGIETLAENHEEKSEDRWAQILKDYGFEDMKEKAIEAFVTHEKVSGGHRISDASSESDLWNALDTLNLFDKFVSFYSLDGDDANESEKEVIASKEDLAIIQPYFEVAQKALEQKKIANIMDSAILYPKGYDGDVYFTVEHNNGKFDMVQLQPDSKKVTINRDIDGSGKDIDKEITPDDLTKILKVK